MILGLGIDVVEVARIERAISNPRFLARILTPREAELIRNPSEAAGRWAAKEALAKAVPGLRAWQDVEILRGSHGEPVVNFVAGVLGPGQRVHLSITHERGVAAAVAILEGFSEDFGTSTRQSD